MKKILLLIILSSAFCLTKAQYSFHSLKIDTSGMSFNQKYEYAEYYVGEERYAEAAILFNDLLTKEPENNDLHFRLGFCYLFTNERYNSITHLEKVVNDYKALPKKKKKDIPTDVYYFLGRAYYLNYDFVTAAQIYNELLVLLTNEDDKIKLQQEIKACKDAQEIFENPVDIIVTKLAAINSSAPDHSPVVSADETVLIFTSRREGSTGGELDKDGEYFEDIYVFDKTKGFNTKPIMIDTTVNSVEHEATCGLSVDGQELFIYKSNKGDKGNILYSKNAGDGWSIPIPLNEEINSAYRESHATVSADGKKLYFTSDRPGGFGGMDIYVAERISEDTWGNVKNLGSTINTAKDEEGPFLHPDNRTLYFSSQGHKTLGGFDVFTSYMNDAGMWETSKNMGFPLNTVDNDVFFVPTVDGNRGYYSSQQDGKSSIYIVDILDPTNRNLILMKGFTYDSESSEKIYPLSEVVIEGKKTRFADRTLEKDKVITYGNKIYITDRTITKTDVKLIDSVCLVPRNTEIYVMKIQKKYVDNVYEPLYTTGKYTFVLYPQNEYLVYYGAENHMYDLKYVYEKERGFYNIFYKAEMDTLIRGKIRNSKLTPMDKELSDCNQMELDILADFMKKYDYTYVNFSTHDYNDPGTPEMKSKEDKAVAYLLNKGITQDRIVTQLSPNTIVPNNLEYTILDEITKKEWEDLKKEPFVPTVTAAAEVSAVFVSNITFDIRQYETKNFNTELNNLATYLKDNKNAKIKIEGYTDTQGLEEYNKNLSKKRAEFVENYLISQGVDKKQVVSVAGKGFEIQISLNKDDKGEYIWESLPYNRRVEFVITSQGENSKLLIKQIQVPDKYILSNPKDGADVYSIVFTSLKENKDLTSFTGITNPKVFKDKSGTHYFYYGTYKNLSAAQTELNKIKTTYKDAFIFKNNL